MADFSVILPKIEASPGFWFAAYSPLPDGPTVDTFNADYRRDVFAGLTEHFHHGGCTAYTVDHTTYPLPLWRHWAAITHYFTIDLLTRPASSWHEYDAVESYDCFLFEITDKGAGERFRTLWRNSATNEAADGALEVLLERTLLSRVPKLAASSRKFNGNRYTYVYSEIENLAVCKLPKARLVRRGFFSRLLNL